MSLFSFFLDHLKLNLQLRKKKKKKRNWFDFLVLPCNACVGSAGERTRRSISWSGSSSATRNRERKKKRIRQHSSRRHIDSKHIHHVTIRRRGEGRRVADKEAFLLFPLCRWRASLHLLAPISLSAHFKAITVDPRHAARSRPLLD